VTDPNHTSSAPTILDHPVEMMNLRDLTPAGYNPRHISPEAQAGLRRSLEKFGLADKIVWNRRSGRVVGGHQRLDILLRAGVERARVVVVDLDDEAEKAMNVTLNNPLIAGEFTEDLGPLLDSIREWDPGLYDDLRFEDLRLDVFELDGDRGASGEDDAPRDDLGDPNDIPEVEEVAVSRLGDLWILGDHRLLCGSSTVDADVRRLMGGERARLFATDPPYLVDYDKDEGVTWDDSSQGQALYDEFIRCAVEHAIEPDAAWYCWHASVRQSMVEAAWAKAGARVHQQIIWAKDRPVLGWSHYLWSHEPCFFGWLKGNRPPRTAADKLRTVWPLPTAFEGEERPDHPTPKPIDAFGIPMRQHLRPGDLCYEPFGGSGSQIIAGETHRRRVFTMELSPVYVDLIVRRWQRYTGRAATLDGDGRAFEAVERERVAVGDTGRGDTARHDTGGVERAAQAQR